MRYTFREIQSKNLKQKYCFFENDACFTQYLSKIAKNAITYKLYKRNGNNNIMK